VVCCAVWVLRAVLLVHFGLVQFRFAVGESERKGAEEEREKGRNQGECAGLYTRPVCPLMQDSRHRDARRHDVLQLGLTWPFSKRTPSNCSV
jgi:hypothetical protein